MQPLIKDDHGVVRFQKNKIVDDLLEFAQSRGFGLNEIAVRGYSQADQEQFAQLIGYSVSGYHELSYVSDKSASAANRVSQNKFNITPGCRDHGCKIHRGVKQQTSSSRGG